MIESNKKNELITSFNIHLVNTKNNNLIIEKAQITRLLYKIRLYK